MNNYSVYMHVFPNNKKYIGLTRLAPEERWGNGHNYKRQQQSFMYKAIKKYGWNNIEHIILRRGLSKEEAGQEEKEFIKRYKTTDSKLGYNLNSGGFSDWTVLNETKKKISDTLKKYVFTEEHRKNISKSQTGRISPIRGRKLSKAHCKNISLGKMGKKLSEEHRLKFVLGGARSTERRSKKVMCIDNGKVFKSVSEACRKIGIKTFSNMSRCCSGKTKTCNGKRWKFV